MSVAHPTYYKGLLLNNLSNTKINYKAYYQDIILFGYNAVTTSETVQANTEIWYTSTDSATVTPYSASSIGTLVSNTYSNGKGVMTFSSDITTIGQSAFSGCSKLQTVTLPDSVTSIGNYGFRDCSSLSSITWSDNMGSIGGAAFNSCSALANIDMKNAYIGNGYTFSACTSLTSFTINNPTNTCIIGQYEFAGCTNLAEVHITSNGSSTASFNRYCFSGCSVLLDIYYDVSSPLALRTAYASQCFNGIATGGTLHVPSGYSDNFSEIMQTSAYYLGYYDWNISDDITQEDTGSTQPNNEIWYTSTDSATVTPYSATNIGTLTSNVYSDGKGVMTFEEDITQIGDNAFSGCSTLQTVTLPDSVTSIGARAFKSCTSLTSVTLPDSVTIIGDYAFYKCSGLTSIAIGDSVTSVDNYAFDGCSSLTSVTIGSGITSIGSGVFYGCSGLTSITIPDSVTTIYSSAFQNCTSLTSVTIGSGVTSIVNYAFYYCSSLTSITAKSTTAPSLGTYTFLSIATGGTLYYPSGSDYSTWLTALGDGWTSEEIT